MAKLKQKVAQLRRSTTRPEKPGRKKKPPRPLVKTPRKRTGLKSIADKAHGTARNGGKTRRATIPISCVSRQTFIPRTILHLCVAGGARSGRTVFLWSYIIRTDYLGKSLCP